MAGVSQKEEESAAGAAFAGNRRAPTPVNEPVKSYAPGSPERAELKARLKSMAAERIEKPAKPIEGSQGAVSLLKRGAIGDRRRGQGRRHFFLGKQSVAGQRAIPFFEIVEGRVNAAIAERR